MDNSWINMYYYYIIIIAYLSSYYIKELLGQEKGEVQSAIRLQYLIDFIIYFEKELERPLVPCKSAIMLDNSLEHCSYLKVYY